MNAAISRILVPVDFSDTVPTAIAHAKRLADVYQAEIHLLHVIEDTFLSAADTSEEYAKEFEYAALERLQLLMVEPEHRRYRTTTAVSFGSPHHAIIEYVGQHHCDLVVVATHGRGAATYMLLGSVAENVLRAASCPVYVARNTKPATV